jgi:sn-glycerol 3-phosphate transport system substrate-binding protein
VQVAGPITELIDGYVAEFEAANPTIDVVPVLAGTYDETLTKIQTTIDGGGQPPALAVLLTTDLYTLQAIDAIVPLEERISQSGDTTLKDDVFPAFWANSQADGQIWSIPFQRSTPVMYYNKDAFRAAGLDPDQPPQNWADLAEVCQQLTMRDGSNVAQWGVQIPSEGFPNWLFQAFAISAGQNLVEDSPTEVFFDTSAAVEGMEFWASLANDEQCMPEGVIPWGSTTNDFTSGKAAIIYHTTGSLTNILNTAPFEVGVAFIPGKDGFGVPTGGGNFYLFKDAPQAQQDAAWKFIEFLTEPERAADWSAKTGYVAIRQSSYDTPAMQAYLAERPQAAVARDQLTYAQKEMAVFNRAEIQRIFTDNHNAALLQSKTAAEAMADAQREADMVLAAFK